MTAESNQDPATIEEDVRRTQDQMGETVEKLEQQLNPRGIVESFMSQDAAANAREVWAIARENPAPVALMAVGAAWLLATSETPAVRNLRERLISKVRGPAEPARTEQAVPNARPTATGAEFDRRG